MNKRSFCIGALLCVMSLCLVGCIFGTKEKDPEQLEDPLKTTKAFYIVGAITADGAPVSNATVSLSADNTTLSNINGAYTISVNATGTYDVTFKANGYEDLKASVTIPANAANRTTVTLNVNLVKPVTTADPIVVDPNKDNNIDIKDPNNETQAPVGTVEIPAGATDEGLKISVTYYQDPIVASPSATTAETSETKEVTMSNLIVSTEPTGAKANSTIIISAPNHSGTNKVHLHLDYIKILKDDGTATRAWSDYGGANFNAKQNQYEIDIPQGDAIEGKYSIRTIMDIITGKIKEGEANKVNGGDDLTVDNSNNYSGIQNYQITIDEKTGWEFTTTPDEALTAAGITPTAGLVAFLTSQIENNESKQGVYTVERTLTTNISGNSRLYYKNTTLYCDKTYTFKFMVDDVVTDVVTKLKCYVSNKEYYTNASVTEHSGGTTGNM